MSTDTKRPQLSLDEVHQLKTLLGGVLGLLSAWTVAFMDVNAWALLLAVTVAGVVVLVRPGLPARLPAWVHRLAFPIIVGGLVFDLVVFREPLPAFIRLNLLLIGYRLIAPRKRRDDLQLVVLGLLLVVVAGVLSVSLLFAVQILAFTACALGFLLTITLVDAGGSPRTPTAGIGAPSWGVLLRRVVAATDWRVAALGAGLFAGVVLLSALLFLAIPRFELSNSFFLDRLINRQTRTGFSDEIRFGEVTDIQSDNRLALTVDVSDRSQVPADPYWRMVVLDEYVAGGFRVSSALRTALGRSVTRTTRLAGTGRFRAGAASWTFYVEPGVSRYLPLLGTYQGIAFTEAQAVGVSDPLNVVALQRDPPRMFAYRVSSMLAAPVLADADRTLDRRNRGSAAAEDLLGPALSPADRQRLAAYNREITGSGDLPLEVYATQASAWLARRHSYSLQSTVPPGDGDPLVRWIGSEEPGHCELFAGALVLLAREAGFPARLVTGFRGGSWNGFSNSFTVRNANAHAWVELFDDAAGGWRRVDPTPGSPGPAADETALAAEERLQRMADNSWTARLESLRVFWYRRIVNFDSDTQVELARAAKEAVDETGRRVRAWLDGVRDRVRAWWERPWDVTRWIGLGAAVLGAALAVWGWRRFGRGWWLRWRSRHARNAGVDPVRREAGRWLVRLREAGGADERLRGELERLRFGPRTTWPNPARTFQEARRACRAARRR